MSFSLTGTIYRIMPEQTIKAGLTKREFVIKYADNPQYPQLLKFEALNDKIKLIENFAEGDEVEIEFNLNGREWVNQRGETLYFTTLAPWRVRPAGQGNHQPSSMPQNEPPMAQPKAQDAPAGDDPFAEQDDLPF